MILTGLVKKIISPPRFFDERENRIANILFTTSAAILIGLCVLLLQRLFIGEFYNIPAIIALMLTMLITLTIIKRGFIKWSSNILLWSLLFFTNYLAYKNDGFHDTAFYIIPGMLIIAGLVTTRKFYLIYTLFGLISITVIGFLEISGVINNSHSYKTNYSDIVDLGIILILTAIVIRLLSIYLNRSLAYQQRIVSSLPTFSFITTDMNAIVTSFSPGAEKIFQYRADEIIGKSVAALHLPEDAKKFPEIISTQKKGKVGFEGEMTLVRKNGEQFPAHFITAPIVDEKNNVIALLGVSHDISESKKNEAILQHRLRFTTAINQLAETIISHDTQGNIMETLASVIGETLQVDRSLICDMSLEKKQAIGLCEWLNPTDHTISPTKSTYPLDYFIGSIKEMQRTKNWIESHIDNINPVTKEDGSGKLLHDQMKIKSGLWYPFAFYDGGFFVIALNQINYRRVWQEEEIFFLETASRLATIALQKFRFLQELEQSKLLTQSANENFLALIEAIPDAIFFKDGNGRWLIVNEAAKNLFQLHNCNWFSKTDQDLSIIHPDLKEAHNNCIESDALTWKSGRLSISQERIFEKDGILHEYEVRKFPIFSDNGERKALVIIGRDVTEQNRVKAVAETLSHQNKLILNSAGEGIFGMDLKGYHTFVNPRAAQLLGYEPEELMGKHSHSTWHYKKSDGNEDTDYDCQIYNSMRDGVTNKVINEVFWKKDGTPLFVEYTSTPIIEAGTIVGVVVVFTDITERINLENKLRQAQKMESLGTLAGGIAHDFNNILNIIISNIDMIASRPDDKEKLQHRIEVIANSVERGARLVRQLLTFARKTEILHTPIIVNDSIQEIKKLLEETFPRTIEIDLFLKPVLPPIIGDPTQLSQILINLSVNARDAMPHGGKLQFRTDTVEGKEIQNRFPEANADRYILIAITDTGTGLDELTQKRIFDPFFTTKEIGKGTGLGLSVVHGIVTRHKGFIDVQSRIGSGTIFSLYFPVEEQPHMQDNATESKNEIAGKGFETILFIEDEQATREIFTEILQNNGYKVLIGSDGEQGLELFNQHRDRIAMIISDLGLPKIGGEELLRRVKQIDTAIPVIIMSGFIDQTKRSNIILEGASDIIIKPFHSNEILIKIRKILDRK